MSLFRRCYAAELCDLREVKPYSTTDEELRLVARGQGPPIYFWLIDGMYSRPSIHRNVNTLVLN